MTRPLPVITKFPEGIESMIAIEGKLYRELLQLAYAWVEDDAALASIRARLPDACLPVVLENPSAERPSMIQRLAHTPAAKNAA